MYELVRLMDFVGVQFYFKMLKKIDKFIQAALSHVLKDYKFKQLYRIGQSRSSNYRIDESWDWLWIEKRINTTTAQQQQQHNNIKKVSLSWLSLEKNGETSGNYFVEIRAAFVESLHLIKQSQINSIDKQGSTFFVKVVSTTFASIVVKR